MSKVYATPGVYIEEKSAFPNSAVPVATAVPAFVGYTEKAVLNKKDITNVPTRISSFGEYLLYFGEGPKTIYTIAESEDRNKVYELNAKNKRFYLFQCIKLFFANGGSDCYIVSIGNYDNGIQAADFEGEKPDEDEPGVNKLIGLKALLKEPEPTMVVMPDAVSLEQEECYALQQKMLLHCGSEMRSRVAILDVYDGFKKRIRGDDSDVVTRFRTGIGANFLQWGAAYYPWVHTTITGAEEVDFTSIDKDTTEVLIKILTAEVDDATKEGVLDPKRAEKILDEIGNLAALNTIAGLDVGAAEAANGNAVRDLEKAQKNFDGATAEEKKQKKKDLDKAKADANMAAAVLAAAQAKAAADKVASIKTPADEANSKAKDAKTAAENADAAVAKAKDAEGRAVAANTAATGDQGDAKKAEAIAIAAEAVAAAGEATKALNDALTAAAAAKNAAAKAKAAATDSQAGTDVQPTLQEVKDYGDAPTEAAEAAALAQKAASDAKNTADNTKTPLEEAKTAAAEAQGAIAEPLKAAKEAAKKAKDAQAAAISADDIKTQHQTLWAISPMYKSIMSSLREKINLLPPSAGMAGIYSMVDNNVGVFQSPANVSVGSVVRPAVNLTNDEQEDLNVPLNGKAVNAIRTFPGKGVLVWGARTLDGNSQDWRYVSVRRTVIFIEQSIKYAAEPYVFSPNTAATWTNVKAMLVNFLTNVWQQGALAGATPEDAFSVHIGLGETMTPVDILDGYMRITVKLAVTRPAEFIVITFEQQMQKS